MKLERPGATLVLQMKGQGETLVFLHAGVADKRMWRPQLAAFADSHRAVAYDRRGFGETEAEDVPFSHIDDLKAVLDALDAEQATLVGCSQGGRIALDFCLTHPARVIGLVLVAPAVSGAAWLEQFSERVQARLDELDKAEETGDLAKVNELEAQLWLDGPASPAGRVSGELREMFLDMNGLALAKSELTQEAEPPSALGRLSNITAPTLLLWGELDFSHVRERCRELLATIPNAAGKELKGAAHLPNLELAEQVNERLRTFLEGSAGQ